MLGNVESRIYAFSTNKWPQMWPQKQIEWATGNPSLDSTRDNTPTSYSIVAERSRRAVLNPYTAAISDIQPIDLLRKALHRTCRQQPLYSTCRQSGGSMRLVLLEGQHGTDGRWKRPRLSIGIRVSFHT